MQRIHVALAKSSLAFQLEDRSHRHATARLDFAVEIVKRALELPRERPADGALAGAHHADQENRQRAAQPH
jgi:hypothetical protein